MCLFVYCAHCLVCYWIVFLFYMYVSVHICMYVFVSMLLFRGMQICIYMHIWRHVYAYAHV